MILPAPLLGYGTGDVTSPRVPAAVLGCGNVTKGRLRDGEAAGVGIHSFIHSYSFNNSCQTAGAKQNKTICRPRNIQVNKHTNTKF